MAFILHRAIIHLPETEVKVRIFSIYLLESCLIDVPAGLIIRSVDNDIEVFLASETESNPYSPGEKMMMDTGNVSRPIFKLYSSVKFSHGLCDDCARELYGEEEWFQKR